MNLVIKRKQRNMGLFGGASFSLWSKLELDDEEKALYRRYNLANAIVCEGDELDSLEKGDGGTGAFLVLLIGLIIAAVAAPAQTFSFFFGGTGMIGILSLVVAFFVLKRVMYNLTRTSIKAADMVNGRHFQCKSILNMNDQEELIKKIGLHVRQLLEDMKNWGGREVMQMDPMTTREYEIEETSGRIQKGATVTERAGVSETEVLQAAYRRHRRPPSAAA